MISKAMWERVDQMVREYWHYNDEGKAYTPETWTPLMQQFALLDRTYRKNGRGYESLVREHREKEAADSQKTEGGHGEDAGKMPEETPREVPVEELQDTQAAQEMKRLAQLERELVQICDPSSLKIPLWKPGNLPDMRKNPYIQLADSDGNATPSLDPEDYMPGFVPYFLEDGQVHPVILVLAGGHRGNCTSGDPVCRYFNGIGCHAVLMGHRVGIQKLNFSLDLQRAIRLLRSRAEEWKVDPNRIGAIGLSFGGVVITDYIEQMKYTDVPSQYDPSYQEDQVDALPGELNAFLGIYTSSDPFLKRSGERNYPQYPPVFQVIPGADPMLDFQVSYLNDLVRHQVRVEAHLFDGGVHGFALGDSQIVVNGVDGHIPAIALWPELAELWLKRIWGSL